MTLLALVLRRFPEVLAGMLLATASLAQPVVISDIANHRVEAVAIRNVVAQGVMNAPRGQFRPDAPMVGADMAASVQRLFDLKPPAVATNFPDVPSTSPIYSPVEAVAPYLGRQILCFGCALALNFLPEEPITELQFAVLITNVLQAQHRIELLTEAQAQAVLANVPDAAKLRGPLLPRYVATAIQAGILSPPTTDRLTTRSIFTRAQAGASLDRVQKKFTITKVHPAG